MRTMFIALLLIVLPAQAGSLLDEEKAGYRSKSGDRYQYDLNRPQDELRYSVDLRAQMRDEVSNLRPDPRRELLEETYGQRGGGRYSK